MSYENLTKKELLALPDAEWPWAGRWFRGLLIIPLRTRHETGYANIAAIGYEPDGTVRDVITRNADVIDWPAAHRNHDDMSGFFPKSDVLWPSGAIRYWAPGFEMQCEYGGSYVDIQVRRVAM